MIRASSARPRWVSNTTSLVPARTRSRCGTSIAARSFPARYRRRRDANGLGGAARSVTSSGSSSVPGNGLSPIRSSNWLIKRRGIATSPPRSIACLSAFCAAIPSASLGKAKTTRPSIGNDRPGCGTKVRRAMSWSTTMRADTSLPSGGSASLSWIRLNSLRACSGERGPSAAPPIRSSCFEMRRRYFRSRRSARKPVSLSSSSRIPTRRASASSARTPKTATSS